MNNIFENDKKLIYKLIFIYNALVEGWKIKMIQKDINENCLSDLGVAVEMASASSNGALMNIKINLNEIKDSDFKNKIDKRILRLVDKNDQLLFAINKIFSI